MWTAKWGTSCLALCTPKHETRTVQEQNTDLDKDKFRFSEEASAALDRLEKAIDADRIRVGCSVS